jgi:hypothetical protein
MHEKPVQLHYIHEKRKKEEKNPAINSQAFSWKFLPIINTSKLATNYPIDIGHK